MNADELVLIETFPAALRHEAETLILRQPYRSRLPVRQGETLFQTARQSVSSAANTLFFIRQGTRFGN